VFAAALANAIVEDMLSAGLNLALAACGPSKAVQDRRAIGVRWRSARTKDTAVTFAVSIKTEALPSSLGRAASAWSSAWRVKTAWAMG